ncbi:MAG: VOC family protein [Pseudomonadota bacterium]
MARSDQPLFSFVPISDADTAKAFYGGVLGLDLLEESPFAVVYRVPGGTLRLATTPHFTPQPFTLVGWVVTDLSSEMETLSDQGVDFLRYDGFGQDEYGVWTVPDGTKICWFTDPDGNVLSLTQPA